MPKGDCWQFFFSVIYIAAPILYLALGWVPRRLGKADLRLQASDLVAASALRPDALERIVQLKNRGPASPFALAIKDADELWDYCPNLPAMAWRLARRAWPGPLTLVLPEPDEGGLSKTLPDAARRLVCPNGTLGFRVPDHWVALSILRMTSGPLALTSVNRSGEPPAVSGREIAEAFPEIDVILDDGPTRYGTASSVVRVHSGGDWELVRAGAISEKSRRGTVRLCGQHVPQSHGRGFVP